MSRQWVSCIGYQRRYLGLMEILMLMCLPSKEWHDPAKLPTRPSGNIISPIFCTRRTEPLERGAKYEQIFADFHWIFGTKSSAGVYQSRIGQTFKSLFHNQLPSAATDDGGKLGLILHRIEIFILNVKPRLRLSLFWTVVGSFHPHQNFDFKFWN